MSKPAYTQLTTCPRTKRELINKHQFPHITIEGPAYERGLQYGAQAAQQIAETARLIVTTINDLELDWDDVNEDIKFYKQQIYTYDPLYLTEMRGIAHGAGVDIESIVLINARAEILKHDNINDGCTTVAVLSNGTQNGHTLMGHNWDFESSYLETGVVLTIKQDDKPDIITIVEAGGLARNGINKLGITVGANYMHSHIDFKTKGGIPLGVLRRAVLDSNSYKDALAVVLQAQKCSSSNILIAAADGKCGDTLCIESTPVNDYIVEPTGDLMIHSNHFISPDAKLQVKDLNMAAAPSTLYRHRRVSSVLTPKLGNITLDDIKLALGDRFGYPYSVCRGRVHNNNFKDIESITIATIVYDLTRKNMAIRSDPNANNIYVKYSF